MSSFDTNKKDNFFKLKIISREGKVFDGNVESITSFNARGKFDVLASHANFISLIKKRLTFREPKLGGVRDINFETALIRVRENLVEVYVGVEGIGSKTVSS